MLPSIESVEIHRQRLFEAAEHQRRIREARGDQPNLFQKLVSTARSGIHRILRHERPRTPAPQTSRRTTQSVPVVGRS